MVLLPEMGASYREGPPIWASGATALEDEATCLIFGAITTVKLVSQMKENGENSKLFLTLNTKLSEEEEESNDDSWKTVVFYRHSDLQRYAARVSRPNLRPTRDMLIGAETSTQNVFYVESMKSSNMCLMYPRYFRYSIGLTGRIHREGRR